MRSGLLLLAGLASSTLALPTASTELDARTVGLVSGLLDVVKDILGGGVSPVNILGGISAEAAAALGGGALGCTAGSIDIEYRKKLAIWLKSEAGLHLDVSLRKSLLSWCEADASVDLDLDLDLRAQLSFFIPACANIAAEADLYVSLEGVFSLASDVLGVLTATAQATLEAAIGLLGDLDFKIQAGLEFCAAGGLIGDLDIEIVNALKVWLNGDKCTLSVELKTTVLAWIAGEIGGDIIELPKLPVGGVTAISLGKSIEVLVETTGALVGSAQAALGAFLQTDIGLDIDTEIKNILALIVKGGLAVDIAYDKRVQLSLWLASSKCALTAELKSLIAFWLSFGVSSGGEVSVGFSTNILSELTGFITGTIDTLLGSQLHGLLSFILSGKGVLSISLEARAQIAALIGGSLDIEIDDSIQIIIIGWLGGCHECCGSPGSSTTPALPTSTPVSPTKTPTVPTSVGPTETPSEPSETPCDTLTSETIISHTETKPPTETPSVPTGTGPSETPSNTPTVPTVPTGAEPSETPCDTLTSETIISHTETKPPTETPSVPTGAGPSETPSNTPFVPTSAQPSETPSETPCETLTTETTISHTESVPPTETPSVPTTPVPTGVQPSETPSAPVPTGTESTETPCETLTTETTLSHTESVPPTQPTETPTEPTEPVPTGVEPTETPCETLTSETIVSSTIPASTITQPPVPVATSTGGQKTVTVTTTVGVAYCPPSY
ncbi:hypothetical protein BDW59DRAFT_33181 [Aspergillus cavernicola]|uniref:Cell wall protein n=1 Tax=Aspergillus cavernicola TaxID=176166 RepID=A0ABR4IPM6_9EURO